MTNKPAFYYSILGWVLLIAGFFVALYLSVSHYRVYTDIGYSSFCAISKSINCDTVSQSGFSILFGMPVPVWGMLGYLFLMLIFPFLFQRKNSEKKLWTLFFVIVFFFSVYSVILAFISTFYIHSYCLMCIVLYAVNLALLFYSYRVIKAFKGGGFLNRLLTDCVYLKSNTAPLFLLLKLFFLLIIVLWMAFPQYWTFEIKKEILNLPSGITEDGSHWIGANNPEVTIIEFSDYMCFQCKKMHFYLRSIVAENPDKIRLVHKHFPLDKAYNFAIKENLYTGSGKMALLAIYAGLKDKFWEMNDLLFQIDRSKGSISLNEIALKMNFEPEELAWALDQKGIRLRLKKDIAFGAKAGVTGTPSYLIKGKLYLGTISWDLFKGTSAE
jgi:protein-disulfide isomerase/uncharacterized membrane protein